MNLSASSKQVFFEEVIQGLRRTPKELPCKYFYDEKGSRLFDRICELDEYYLTRAEQAIMDRYVSEMADLIGDSCYLIEYGSGSSKKTRCLLDALSNQAAYAPIDISHEYLKKIARDLKQSYPHLEILPICADFTSHIHLPDCSHTVHRKVIYFPGSTIGNFLPSQVDEFLEQVTEFCGAGDGFLIGMDLKKDKEIIEAAYNDHEGITDQFNRNILVHINRELSVDFKVEQFKHQAFYNADQSRVEVSLVSLEDQTVHLNGEIIRFKKGESIHTEYSHKFDLDEFAQKASLKGWQLQKAWTDPDKLFGVMFLTR